MNKGKEAKVKKQKEIHSEIERKRRERMKRETEFLSTQLLDKAVRKDKLSIYKAGADQLLRYAEKLGKREFILNDSEYSAIIVNNFSGIGLHINCSDGEIFWCNNKIKTVLGLDEVCVIGSTIYSICEPSFETINIIEGNLSVDSCDEEKLKNGELISRTFIVGLKISDKFSKENCTRGLDGKWYRFIELCGDLSINTDERGINTTNQSVVFKGLGRPLDLSYSNKNEIISFTTKLDPENFRIIEIFGNVQFLLGMKAADMVDRNLCDFIVEEERQYFKSNLLESITNESRNFFITLNSAMQNCRKKFSVSLDAIYVNKKLLFVIGKFESSTNLLIEHQMWPKLEPISNINTYDDDAIGDEDEDVLENSHSQIIESQVTFNLAESDLLAEINDRTPCVHCNCVAKEKTTDDDEENGSLNEKSLGDIDNLPSNDSFKSLIGDCNELFQPDSIRDLVSEDINDIQCYDGI